MAHKSKKRKTGAPPPPAAASTRPGAPRPPKSMVIRLHASNVGPSISQLTSDFRRLMSPDTASRLRERRANKLKDYLAMTGPLGVTHLFLFSRSKNGNVHFRVCLAPRGPTLTFRVDQYSLARDVGKSQKRPRGGGGAGEFNNAPLVVMNNFAQQQQQQQQQHQKDSKDQPQQSNQDPILKQVEGLMTTVFQGIFPAITPSATKLDSIKRILLLNRETTTKKAGEQSDEGKGTFTINLRHYAITTRQSGVSKRVRRFDAEEQRRREKKSAASSGSGHALPDLGRLEDAADYLLDPSAAGYTSASDTELDSENEVEVLETETQRVLSRKQRQQQRDAEANARTEGDGGDGDDQTAPQQQQPQHQQQPKSHVEKRAVKLVELGPRMKLRLVKVEEGICDGKVMWNEFVNKSKEEERELEGKWKVRRQEKEERRRIQKENVERKRKEKGGGKGDAAAGGGEDDDDGDNEGVDEAMEYGSDFDMDDFDDVDAGMDGEGWEDADGSGDEDEDTDN